MEESGILPLCAALMGLSIKLSILLSEGEDLSPELSQLDSSSRDFDIDPKKVNKGEKKMELIHFGLLNTQSVSRLCSFQSLVLQLPATSVNSPLASQ